MVYWIKTNWIIKHLFSSYVWNIPVNEKIVFLTFDDGPTPEITEWTLTQLKVYNAKATFFCIGKNSKNHPQLLSKIRADGHVVGNHTFDHLNGWKTKNETYIENVIKCDSVFQSKLFRPPYGKIKGSQARDLKKLGYKIIMWEVLSGDFDQKISKEKCLENVINNVTPGSIVIFHDSEKAYSNLQYALPKTLKFLKDKGYSFETIESRHI